MRKGGHKNPAPLFALAGMAALNSAAFAQQPGPVSPTGSADQVRQISPTGGAASQSSGALQSGGIPLKLMDTLIMAYPSIRVDVLHNDNIYTTPNNRTGDRILILVPSLQLEARSGGNTYSLRMSSAIGQYQTNTANDYTNTSLNALADLDLGTSLRARLQVDYIDGVDPRGSNNNPISPTPDHYRQTNARGIFSYGRQGALGRLDVELGEMQRHYLNNRATTAGSDHAVDSLGATFYWRVGPKTTLLLQGKGAKFDYSDPSSTLDSTESTIQAGATWEASAKTSGTFRVGMTRKDFEDPARGNWTNVTWAGQIRWSPRTYSHVDLNLIQAPAETTGGVGDYILRTTTAARWTHDWTGRFTTDALVSYMTDAYKGAPRTDHTQNYGVKATYKVRRWLTFGGDYAYTLRNSTDNAYDYKRSVFMLFLNATL